MRSFFLTFLPLLGWILLSKWLSGRAVGGELAWWAAISIIVVAAILLLIGALVLARTAEDVKHKIATARRSGNVPMDLMLFALIHGENIGGTSGGASDYDSSTGDYVDSGNDGGGGE